MRQRGWGEAGGFWSPPRQPTYTSYVWRWMQRNVWPTRLWQSRKEYPTEKRQSLQQVVLGKLDSDMQNNEPGPLSYTIHKNKLKMDETPNCKTGSHQNPWGESRQNLFDLDRSNFLLNMSSEARETKAKMNYWALIKIKNLCTAKETFSKSKRQLTEWETIFANDISDKGLVSKIYKELIKSTPKKTIQWRNGQKTWIDTSSKKTSR